MAKGRRFPVNTIILVVLLGTVGYTGFRLAQILYIGYVDFFRPTVVSDAAIHNAAYPVLGGPLPEQSHHLYFARKRFELFLAFSLNSQKECEEFLERQFGLPLQKVSTISDLATHPLDVGPQTWGEKYKDPNWQIDRETDIFYCKDAYCQAAYIPNKCRIYLFQCKGP
jgi:hypothetical protein